MQEIKNMLTTLFISGLLSLTLSTNAYAAFVTIDETLIDNIYNQTVFGSNSIDVRFNSPLTIPFSPFLTVNSNADITNLYNFAKLVNGVNYAGISLFFLDAINFCNGSGSNIVGCSATTTDNNGAVYGLGSISMVNSSYAASAIGGVIIAHELAHNLGLSHESGTNTNLMNPAVYNGSGLPPLTTDQVNTILSSKLIQTDSAGQKFLEVTPFAVIASVPEPSTFLMLMLGLVLILLPKKFVKLRKPL